MGLPRERPWQVVDVVEESQPEYLVQAPLSQVFDSFTFVLVYGVVEHLSFALQQADSIIISFSSR